MLSNLSLGNARTSLIGMLVAALGIPSCSGDPASDDWAGLSSKDVGQYAAVPWQAPGAAIQPGSYWDRVRDLNFVVAKQQLTDDLPDSVLDTWAAAAIDGTLQQKKLLLSLNFWDGDERYKGDMRDISVYWDRLSHFLDGMEARGALADLQGIVLAEENIAYGGRPELLTGLYNRLKQTYDVAVWQWWSPSTALPSSAGWIPADGWVVDMYFVPNPGFRQHVRKYFVAGTPVVIMPWATSYLSKLPPMTPEQWQANNDQLAVALEFDLPVAFYWTLNGTSYFDGDRNNPGTDEIGLINQWVWNYIQQVQQLPTNYTGESSADSATADALNVKDFSNEAGTLHYQDDFSSQKWIDDASASGFRDFLMNGQTLSFRGYRGRRVQAALMYHFQGDASLSYPSASLTATIASQQQGHVELALSTDGKRWSPATTARRGGTAVMTVNTSSHKEFGQVNSFYVRITVTGDPGSKTAPTVSIDNLTIAANPVDNGTQSASSTTSVPSSRYPVRGKRRTR